MNSLIFTFAPPLEQCALPNYTLNFNYYCLNLPNKVHNISAPQFVKMKLRKTVKPLFTIYIFSGPSFIQKLWGKYLFTYLHTPDNLEFSVLSWIYKTFLWNYTHGMLHFWGSKGNDCTFCWWNNDTGKFWYCQHFLSNSLILLHLHIQDHWTSEI